MKRKLYFWNVQSEENFPMLVYNTEDLTEEEVGERARNNNVVSRCGNVSVRRLELNEVKMRSPYCYAYSLQPQAERIDKLLKECY